MAKGNRYNRTQNDTTAQVPGKPKASYPHESLPTLSLSSIPREGEGHAGKACFRLRNVSIPLPIGLLRLRLRLTTDVVPLQKPQGAREQMEETTASREQGQHARSRDNGPYLLLQATLFLGFILLSLDGQFVPVCLRLLRPINKVVNQAGFRDRTKRLKFHQDYRPSRAALD